MSLLLDGELNLWCVSRSSDSSGMSSARIPMTQEGGGGAQQATVPTSGVEYSSTANLTNSTLSCPE